MTGGLGYVEFAYLFESYKCILQEWKVLWIATGACSALTTSVHSLERENLIAFYKFQSRQRTWY